MFQEYRITIHLKTVHGFETFAEFFLGNSCTASRELFRQLKGTPIQNQEGILIMELAGLVRGLPVEVDMLSCSLEELGDNCKVITKYLFTQTSLAKSAE
jgi:hypothetical protein